LSYPSIEKVGLELTSQQRQETYKRTQEMLEVFKARLKAQVEGIKITGQVESYSMRSAYRPRAINSASEGVSQQQSLSHPELL